MAEQFTLFYGEEFLEAMQSSVDILSESCWLKSITRKHRKSFHPIRHLLLIYFLGEEIDTFYQYAHKEYKPFGEGPYFCLNPAAKHYKQRVIPNVKTTFVQTQEDLLAHLNARVDLSIPAGDRIRVNKIYIKLVASSSMDKYGWINYIA